MAYDLASNVRRDMGGCARVETRTSFVSTLPLDDPRLEPFVLNHPQGLIFHHPAYLRTLEEESGQECILLASQDKDGALESILPLFFTRGLPFNIGLHQTKRRLCSLPRTPVAGVLSTSEAAATGLLQEAVRLANAESGIQVQIKCGDALPVSQTGFVATNWRPTYSLSLPQSGDWLQSLDTRGRHKIKWGVNKAIKLGLGIREAESEADLRAWYELYLGTMRDNLVLPRPYRYFLALWRHLRPRGLMRLSLAEMKNAPHRSIVAGSLFLMASTTVFYAFTGCSMDQVTTHANDLILWDAIERASRESYRYVDFGEVAEDHPELARYKRKWGCEVRPLYRYYYPAASLSTATLHPGHLDKLIRRVWRTVPLALTSQIGDWLYHYL